MAQLQLEENRKGKKGKERNWTENERNRKEQKRKEKKGIGQKMRGIEKNRNERKRKELDRKCQKTESEISWGERNLIVALIYRVTNVFEIKKIHFQFSFWFLVF